MVKEKNDGAPEGAKKARMRQGRVTIIKSAGRDMFEISGNQTVIVYSPMGQAETGQKVHSILAMAIVMKLRIGPGWKPFERLWGMKNLSSFHAAAQDRSYYKEKLKEYEKFPPLWALGSMSRWRWS